MFYSAVRAHGGLVIADEVSLELVFLFLKVILRVELVLEGLENTCGAFKVLE